jgi:UDPglucose 6-dehydrogenase
MIVYRVTQAAGQVMKLTIAGYGTVGRYVEEVFGQRHDVAIYDEPKHIGDSADLVDTDFVFVCVPTPPLGDGRMDTCIVEEIVRRSAPRVAIVCESTLPVGGTDRIMRVYDKNVVYVPEYAGESAEHPFRNPANRDFVIYGGYEPAASAVRELFKTAYPASARHDIVPPVTAELVKLAENSFLAMKVAFCNELFDLCDRLDVPYEDVRALWAQDWRIGPSHTFVTEERGYGGKCLPKDIAALCLAGRDEGVPLEILEAVRRSNDRRRTGDASGLMPARATNGR